VKLVITGYGIVSTVGVGNDAFESALPHAERHTATKASSDAVGAPLIREIPEFDPAPWLGDKGLRSLDRLTKELVLAARFALHDAGLKKDGAYVGVDAEAIGFCCSNAYGSLEAINELDRVAVLEDAYDQLLTPVCGQPQLRLLHGQDGVHKHDEHTCNASLELPLEVVIRNTVHHNRLHHDQVERPPR
jgi:3-oxoacyl-(acyl-carrier-protein) synthase